MTGSQITAQPLLGSVLAPSEAAMALAEWTADAAPGPDPAYQAPLHRHAEDEAWYVLEGMLRVRAGDQIHEVTAGGAIVVPGETPHTFWNPGSEQARYLLVMGARTYALIQAIHAAEDRSAEHMRALYAAHGATLLEP